MSLSEKQRKELLAWIAEIECPCCHQKGGIDREFEDAPYNEGFKGYPHCRHCQTRGPRYFLQGAHDPSETQEVYIRRWYAGAMTRWMETKG